MTDAAPEPVDSSPENTAAVPQERIRTGTLSEALRELRQAGGAKPVRFCRITPWAMKLLVEAGWATVDEGPQVSAFVRLTDDGRFARADH